MQKFVLVLWNISEPIKKKNWIEKIILVHSKLKYRENIWGKILFYREKPVLKDQHCLQKNIFPFNEPLKSIPNFPHGLSTSWLACRWRFLSL